MTIFFISDIHRRQVHDSIIEQARNCADIVVIGGDLVERGVKRERVLENIQLLKEIGPIFFIWGNNDYEWPPLELEKLLLSQNVTLLRNQSYRLEIEEGKDIYLIGVDDFGKGNCDKAQAFAEVPSDSFKILLSHNPLFVKRIMEKDYVSLFLSGHTHGGQIRILGFGLYAKGGWTKKGNMHVLVSNGYGTSTLPLRLGAKAEAHLIKIVS